MAENPNKISQIQVGSVTYDIYDAAARTLLPDHEKDDPAYITLPLNTADVEPYSEGFLPKIRRWGPIVHLIGAFKLKADQPANFDIVAATLDQKYRPVIQVDQLCQASNTDIWLMQLSSNDICNLTIARHRSGSSYTSATTGTWFPFNVTYFVKDGF